MTIMLQRAGLTANHKDHHWRVLVTDSHYTCMELATELYDLGVGLIGTVRLATKSRSPAKDVTAHRHTTSSVASIAWRTRRSSLPGTTRCWSWRLP